VRFDGFNPHRAGDLLTFTGSRKYDCAIDESWLAGTLTAC
jgi:hypothetical protein